MKKKYFLIIAGLVGLIVAYFVWDNFLRTAPSMKKLDADYRVNAMEFYAEFEENEEAANVKYLNRIIEVVGEVDGIEVTDDTKPVISLKTEGFGVIKCTMESDLKSSELEKIQPNSTLVIRAECIGMLLDVLMTRSIIIEPI